jgi:hypothetical protein
MNTEGENNNFDILITIRSDINDLFVDIDNKLKTLNALHTDLVKTHVDSSYRLGLDSFHFQNRLIQLENDSMKTIFIYIDNRIYCEYYKLYKIICEYITSDLNDKLFADKLVASHKKFPIYKDLEPTKVYDFNTTQEISSSIDYFISEFKEYIIVKKRELEIEERKANSGINIHNLVNEQDYKIRLVEEKTNMFMRYLNTFNTHHTNYFNRLMSKLKLMNDIVNEDINLKQNTSLQMKKQIKQPVQEIMFAELSSSPVQTEHTESVVYQEQIESNIVEEPLIVTHEQNINLNTVQTDEFLIHN